jgi:phosphatidylglycerophosphate synthase
MHAQEQAIATPETAPHNNGLDSIITRPFARAFEAAADPLVEHFYGPIAEKNRTAGLIAVNLTLTAPRLLEPYFGDIYTRNIQNDNTYRAFGALLIKAGLKVTDGLDGPVARKTGTTSLFGAGFDGFVDMIGTRDDGRCIEEGFQATGQENQLISGLVRTRVGLDLGTMLTGGAINAAAAMYAEKKGKTVPEKDKPKANAAAKAKFATSTVADAALLLTTVMKSPDNRKKIKTVGAGLLAVSVAAGAVSIWQYGKSIKRNLALAKNTTDLSDGPDSHRV